ncbi:DUF7345 domain-containing protein [Halobacteriaceae archaeon SHR40]|uniref:DUF7345 domain-containing protein n=1 Tax=Halovenus amylolytica TaxID=2500550 RepID=UPI000FE3A06C
MMKRMKTTMTTATMMMSNHDCADRTERRDWLRSHGRQVSVVAVCLALAATMVIAASGGATAQVDDPSSEAMIVSVQEDGDATVTLTVPFDLTVEEERRAYEGFRSDETRQQQLLDRYETRLSNVATETNAGADREMAVSEPEIETRTHDSAEVGVVRVTADWEQLAATDGDKVRIDAPFDSGFETDRALTIEPPETHQITAASPDPSTNDGQAVWESDQRLDGFEVTMAPTDAATDSDGTGAGFGILAAVLALAGLLGISRRR